jgi:antibiotic biosynthesis monooxygenase (ABM) superfamily enzyme
MHTHSQSTPQQSDPITLVISEIVKPDRIQEYERWATGISQAAQQYPGFISTDMIRPRDHDHPEYVVVVKFDNYDHFRTWRSSATCQEWLSQAKDFLVDRTYQQQLSGLEMWFTLPASTTQPVSPPAYYKQVIVGVLGVYPLILLADAVVGPFLKGWHPLLGLLLSVTIVSALLTYPVMPWITRLLSFWLYPKVQKKRRRKD